jgi:RNA polymerase subunit RPABC4/transcription elongation factor Spt4
MDFLEDLFDFGDRKRRKKGGYSNNDDHHDDDQNHDHDDDHDSLRQYPNNSYPQVPTNPMSFLPGVVCRKCSTLTVRGSKFCHECGGAITMMQNCASCGSKLPADAPFCPQCGYNNG